MSGRKLRNAAMLAGALGAAACSTDVPDKDFNRIDVHASNCSTDDASQKLYGDELKPLSARVEDGDLVVDAQILTADDDAIKKVLESGNYRASVVFEPASDKNSNDDVYGSIDLKRDLDERGALGVQFYVPLEEVPFTLNAEEGTASAKMWLAFGESGMGSTKGECSSYMPTVEGKQRVYIEGPIDIVDAGSTGEWTVE